MVLNATRISSRDSKKTPKEIAGEEEFDLSVLSNIGVNEELL